MNKAMLCISTLLLLTFNACTDKNSSIEKNIAQQISKPKMTSLILSQEDDTGTGGNPEVYIAHECLKSEESTTCLNQLFSDERKVRLPFDEIIKLAGRSTKVEKGSIETHDDDFILLYLDTSNVKVPLSINVTSVKKSSDSTSTLFMLPVKDMREAIVIKDKTGNIILQYKVIKE